MLCKQFFILLSSFSAILHALTCVTYLSVVHNLLFSFISLSFISFLHIVSYSSPLTGKRYNADYRANWNFQASQQPVETQTFRPITLTLPNPASFFAMFKPLQFNANANWNFNHGSPSKGLSSSYGPPPPPPSTTQSPPHQYQSHSFHKLFNWDVNWNFNHGSSSSLGAASTHEKEESPVPSTTRTTTTTTEKPTTLKHVGNNNSNGFHGEKRINLEWSLNSNHGSIGSSSSSSSASSGGSKLSTELQPPNKSHSNDSNFDDDIENNDANNES